MICRPSMISNKEIFYCKRGFHDKYKIYRSKQMKNGKWKNYRIACLPSGSRKQWDGNEQCYPFVFSYRSKDFMLYSGNDYGKGGLGMAVR